MAHSRRHISLKAIFAISLIGLLLMLVPIVYGADFSWTNEAADNALTNPANWDNGQLPTGDDVMYIETGGTDKAILNEVFPSTLSALRIGTSGNGELEIQAGGQIETTASNGRAYIGSSAGSSGLVNQFGGGIYISSDIQVGGGTNGTWNLMGGVLRNGRGDLKINENGTLSISGGSYESRAKVIINSGGTFEVIGSNSHFISLGSVGSVDGYWYQAAGGTFSLRMDERGVTPVEVRYVDGTGENGDVFFASDALLDVDFMEGVDVSGSWDVMHWDGTLIDNGLQFAPNVDTSVWHFDFVDTNGDGDEDTLRVISADNGTTTSNGIPHSWLDTYFPNLTTSADYEALDTIDSDNDGLVNYLEFQANTNPTDQGHVFTLEDLIKYTPYDNVTISMEPGIYTVTAQDIINNHYNVQIGEKYKTFALLKFSGNNTTYDLRDVTIELSAYYPLHLAHSDSDNHIVHIFGNDNHIRGLEVKSVDDTHTYTNGTTMLVIDGHDNLVEDMTVLAQGSFPYGYGSYFGIGSTHTIAPAKRNGILLRGDNNHLLNPTVFVRSFGHGIFMQGALSPIVEGCYVEGMVRTTDDMLAETSGPAYDVGFVTAFDGAILTAGRMESLSEDGVRAYNSGLNYDTMESRRTTNVTIKDCVVRHMRGNYSIVLADGGSIENSVSYGAGLGGFLIGTNQSCTNCSGDAVYMPLYRSFYDNRSNTIADVTVLPRPTDEYYGNDFIAFIGDNNGDITFKEPEHCGNRTHGRIIVSGYDNRFSHEDSNYQASNNDVINQTGYAINVGGLGSDNTLWTYASVIDNGTRTTQSSLAEPSDSCGTYDLQYPYKLNLVPGLIEAEGFDGGGEGISYADTTTGNCGSTGYRGGNVDLKALAIPNYEVSCVEDGEWLEYTAQFAEGMYQVDFFVDPDTALNASIGLTIDGTYHGEALVPNGGATANPVTENAASSFATISIKDVEIPVAGTYIIRLDLTGGGFDLDSFEFVNVRAPRGVHVVPGTIEAEAFDYGAFGDAYRDTNRGDAGSAGFRTTDVDMSQLNEDNYKIGWVEDGEWLEYTAQFQAGTYQVDFSAASKRSNAGDIQLSIDGVDYGTADIESTGDWNTFADFSIGAVTIDESGEFVIRLYAEGGNFDIDNFTFTQLAPTAVTISSTDIGRGQFLPIIAGLAILMVCILIVFRHTKSLPN